MRMAVFSLVIKHNFVRLSINFKSYLYVIVQGPYDINNNENEVKAEL